MPTNTDLAALQDLDLALDERRPALRGIDLRLAENGALYEARAAVHDSEAALRDLDTRQREADRLVQEAKTRLDAEDRRLYSGAISSPKELAALQHEVETMRQQAKEREDMLLALMAEAEDAGARQAAAQNRFRQLQADRASEVTALQERRTEIERAMADLESRRSALAARIPTETLSLYDGLRRRRQGRAVARIERGACGGCRIALPIATATRARQGATLIQCPSCERILVGT